MTLVVRPMPEAMKPYRRRGYRPSDLVCHFPWPDIGEAKATEKPMRFWLRDLV